MAVNELLLTHLQQLTLTRMGGDEPAGLLVTSLPVPRDAPLDWKLAGQPTHGKPLGRWPDAPGPRRLLLTADSGGDAPEHISLRQGASTPDATPPTVEMETFAYAPAEDFHLMYWERSMLTVAWNGRRVSLAMGMRVHGEVHWWEACNVDIISRSASCVEVEMGGAIPHELTTADMVKEMHAGKPMPYIHRHNWLNGHIYARLHANGVCEVYAHHVNSMFADDGADLPDAVPVLGIRVDEADDALAALCGAWDGSRDALTLGGVAFDLTDVARLATPEQPGQLELVDGFLVLQPYLGMQLYGGEGAKKHPRDDNYYWKAEEQVIPRGRGRTLRFSMSLNDARSPRVARYLAPDWWYGLCEEFHPHPLLPARNLFSDGTDSARHWAHVYMIPRGFEDGILPNQHDGDPLERQTPACEGDVPGTLFLSAYRTGDPRDYDCAMRASYAFTDIIVDHAVNRVICWPFGPDAVALPLQRAEGPLFAWLETGDAYCLQTARAVLDTAYHWQKNSWPRRAVGRDACSAHGMILLYRYLGDAHYLEIARDFIHDIGVSQWPNGAFGDQGGGAGVHGNGAYLAKPWMGWIATMPVLDYLEFFPDDEEAQEIVRKFVEWLMSERAPRHERSHPDHILGLGWTYMHHFKGKALPELTFPEGPTQGMHLFHMEYLARLLPWQTYVTGDISYFEAFMESYEADPRPRTASYWDGSAIFHFLPWLQDRLWNARLTEKGIEARPAYLGERMPATGTLSTPNGPVTLTWTSPESVDAPDGVSCVIEKLREVVTP